MSGFLERIVAHHASAPTIRPRPASRFEDAGPVPVESVEALVDPDPGGRPSGSPAPPTDTAEDPFRLRRVASPATAGDGPAADRPVPAAAHDMVDGIERAGLPTDHLQAEQPAAPRWPVPAVARAADAALPARSDGASRPGEPRSARTPAPAVATSVRVAEPAGRRDIGTRTPDREPDVVEVHIGRIEVRAVVAAPERPAPALPRQEPVRPLSLERYLSRRSDA
jgi:hypothetical protein